MRVARAEAGERAGALALRRRVFCDEQGVPEEIEVDALDETAIHLVALAGDEVVATCRVLFDGGGARVGRMAVERSRRRAGLGSALLAAAEAVAREHGARGVTLHAQTGAAGFYARAGYVSVGQPFGEAGIEHVAMEKRLA